MKNYDNIIEFIKLIEIEKKFVYEKPWKEILNQRIEKWKRKKNNKKDEEFISVHKITFSSILKSYIGSDKKVNNNGLYDAFITFYITDGGEIVHKNYNITTITTNESKSAKVIER